MTTELNWNRDPLNLYAENWLSRITRKVEQHWVKDFAAAQMGTKQRTKFEDTQTSGSLLTPIKSLFTSPEVFLFFLLKKEGKKILPERKSKFSPFTPLFTHQKDAWKDYFVSRKLLNWVPMVGQIWCGTHPRFQRGAMENELRASYSPRQSLL